MSAPDGRYLEFQNDGVSLHPLEVIFVKVKGHWLDLGAFLSVGSVAALRSWLSLQTLPAIRA